MVKVMYLPINGEVEQEGMYDAFRESGVELMIFDYYRKFLQTKNKKDIKQQFVSIAKEFKPDLLHMQLQFMDVITSEDLNEVRKVSPKTIITDWTGDIQKDVPWTFAEHSKGTDISLISSVGQLGMYRKACTGDVRYWQIGYNPKWYYPMNKTEFKYDLIFAASKYKDNEFPDARLRTEWVTHFQGSLSNKFGLFGHRWSKTKSVQQKQMNALYNDSFAVLSINNFNDVDMYFSDRLLMCMATGRPCISYRFSGWEQYFTNMRNIVIVHSKEEVLEKLKWLKEHPQEASAIGRAGSEIVRREHTYFCRAQELLRMVGLK